MGLAETIEAVELADVQDNAVMTIAGCTLEQAKTIIKDRYERQIASEHASATKHFEGIGKLQAAGFNVTGSSFLTHYWRVSVTDLPKIRKAIGKMEMWRKEAVDDKDPTGEGRQMVEVTLRCVDYPTIKVEYLTPYKEGGKCKIVVQTTTTRSLVCSI